MTARALRSGERRPLCVSAARQIFIFHICLQWIDGAARARFNGKGLAQGKLR